MLSRVALIQSLLDRCDNPTYLEVGVNVGLTFLNIDASLKIGVDPQFLFDWRQQRSQSTRLYETTSDCYFGSMAAGHDLFDVIFLDGLHTFEQTLRDLINAIDRLKPRGIVVIDDVLPNSYHASLPDIGIAKSVRTFLKADHDPSWMGDVFKLVFFIDTFFQQYSFATVTESHGQLVMWKSPRSQIVERSVLELAQLQFSDVITKQKIFNIKPFDEILKDIAASNVDRAQC